MHSETTPILEETLGAIREILGPELDGITVERAVIGLFFTGVKLTNGIAGACATPIKTMFGARDAVSRQAQGTPGLRPRVEGARRQRYPPRRRHCCDECARRHLLTPAPGSRCRAALRHRCV